MGNMRFYPFVFAGKERDEETGYSYFGARYYDSDLSGLFLSVDPMADKYPSISPYVYCAWNPIKLVDHDGREIDDYFSNSGKYLGTDNSESNNVRIISEMQWNMLQKDSHGRVDHETGNLVSVSFSTASANGMSIDAQLTVYNYYNPTHYKVESAPKDEITSNNQGMITKIGCGDRKTDKAIVKHLYVKLKNNCTPNGYGEALCDNADEIVNSFVHERNHIKRAIKMGYSKWAKMNETKEGKRNVEKSAIKAQRNHSSWKRCRGGFKKGVENYENGL